MFPLQRGAATWLFLVLTTLTLAWTTVSASENNQRVVCYYTNWSVYRPGTAKFNPQNINPYLCTHLIYSFGGFTKENSLKPYDKYQDIEKGGFAKFTGLKTYNKNLKTMLAIGGWNEGSSRFSPLVADSDRRSQFVKNTIKFLRQNHFDGLDLDWEYPAFRDGSKPKDRENYAQLVQELREEFDRESSKTGRPRLLLTMAVPAGIEYIEKGYDVAKLNKYLDWFNLLTYDYHSAYEPAVNHHSPLYPLEEASEYNFDSELNIDYSIKFYLNAGADRDKLVLGIPTYGRSYTLYNPDATEIGSPADGPGEQGDATREKGYLAYYEICTAVKEDPEWTVVQPNPGAMGPYAYKGNQWVGYDDEAIARKKAKYVVENGLGGIMFWSIDNDDFRGTCHGKPYPIIEAAKETLLTSTDVGVNDIAVPSSRKKPSRSRSRPATSTRNRLTTDNNNEIKSSFKSSQGRKNSRPAPRATTTTTSTTTEGSLYIGGRTTTPQPPTTPDPGADFKCTDEGFFQHPRDCKKYFWCLDAPGLGLVAHQFTCPSGLVFNKLADSCDYARNVVCSKSPPSTTTTTTTTSTSTTTTTTPAPRNRVTVATSRNNFFNRALTTTTTTEPSIEIDYSEEEEDEVQPEEDPQVIKELIALIKKVGGIEELERQLQAQEDGSIVLKSEKADQISTTQSTISKSLYERVLSRAGNGLQKFRPALTFTQTDKSGSTENKYSSVVRNSNTNSYTNSRVAPQNEGIEQLPEFEGVFKERPKYVTLNRARPTKASIEEDADDRSDEESIDEEENQPSTYSTRRPTSSPKYVSIRRQRPTTAADADVEEEEDEETAQQPQQQQQYSSVNRNRFRQTTTEETVDEVERVPSRYNTIERRRATAQYNRLQEADKDDVGTDSSLLVPSTDYETIYTTSSTTDAPEQFITYNTRQYASVERSSTTEATPQTGGPSATDLTQSIPTTTTTTTTTSNVNKVQYNFNTDLQTDLPERDGSLDTVSDLDLSRTADSDSLTTDDAVTVDYSKNEPTYEVTTLLNLGESVTGSSVSELEASVFSSSVGASGDSVNPRIPDSDDQPAVTTTYDSEVQTTPVSPTTTTTVSTTSEKLIGINDEQSNSIYKFSPRTRKTTTTSSPLEVVTNKQEFELTQTQAAPRPFGGAVRRTRPTRRQTSSATTTTAVPEESTTLRSVKVRPQFRPALRRPGGPSFATTTSATPTTTVRNKSTRKSESGETSTTDSNLLLTTTTATATSASLLSRRRRPTTYLSKLNSANRQRPSVLGGSSSTVDEAAGESRRTTASSATTPAIDADQPSPSSKSTRPKVGVRRKFGPTRTGSEGGERGAAATTTTTTKSPDLETTTRTNLFKRRPGFLSPNRITTPATPVTTFSSPANKFFKNRSKSSPVTESPVAAADDQNPAPLDGDVDQEIEPSIRQNNKLVNNKNRYNAIGEGDREGSLEDDLVGAITTISRAPLPSTTSRNFLFPNETPKEKNQHMQMMKVLNIGELPASHQRASTHKYNITHDYTPPQIFSEPFSTTRRSQKLIQRPRISTQSQFYYQQTTPSLYYSSSPVTLSPRKDTPRKRKPSSYEKSSYASSNHRKQKDDFGGRTYRPALDYDYYDDGEQRIIGKSSSQVKVIMHGPGIIECLDQGNFPHPLSCKKFISCAKMEIGGVIGWEYTCPKGLSYDPVGGICNWSAGLGCKD